MIYPAGHGSGKTWSRLSITKKKNCIFSGGMEASIRTVHSTELAFLMCEMRTWPFYPHYVHLQLLAAPSVYFTHRGQKGGLAKSTTWRVWFFMCCIISTSLSLEGTLGFIKNTWGTPYFKKGKYWAPYVQILCSWFWKCSCFLFFNYILPRRLIELCVVFL